MPSRMYMEMLAQSPMNDTGGLDSLVVAKRNQGSLMDLFIFVMLAVNDEDVKQVIQDEAVAGRHLTGAPYQKMIWRNVQPLMSKKLFPWDWATASDIEMRGDEFIAAYASIALHRAYVKMYDLLKDTFMATPAMFKMWCGSVEE